MSTAILPDDPFSSQDGGTSNLIQMHLYPIVAVLPVRNIYEWHTKVPLWGPVECIPCATVLGREWTQKKRMMHASSVGLRSSGKRDSNPRPSAWEADALPTELLPH